jgi:hypothetical protein
LEIVDKDGILIGSSFDVEVKAKNQSKDHKVRTITALDISVAATSYNGETGDEFAEKRFKKDVRLKFNEGNSHNKMHRILIYFKRPGGSMSQVVALPNNSYKSITNTAWVRAQLSKLQKRCTLLAVTSNKVYQLFARGRWFSPVLRLKLIATI